MRGHLHAPRQARVTADRAGLGGLGAALGRVGRARRSPTKPDEARYNYADVGQRFAHFIRQVAEA